MNSTALGAENTKKESIIFISEAHEKFYYEKLEENPIVEDVKFQSHSVIWLVMN